MEINDVHQFDAGLSLALQRCEEISMDIVVVCSFCQRLARCLL